MPRKLTFTCSGCRVTFVGEDAVHRWSMHTWTHIEEVEHLLPSADVEVASGRVGPQAPSQPLAIIDSTERLPHVRSGPFLRR